ncbi:MAG: hypothetical protein AAGD25_20210 [Cyanobacteria bacterium P01_F01_bin.150]
MHENKLPGALRLSPTRTLRNLVGYLVADPLLQAVILFSEIALEGIYGHWFSLIHLIRMCDRLSTLCHQPLVKGWLAGLRSRVSAIERSLCGGDRSSRFKIGGRSHSSAQN